MTNEYEKQYKDLLRDIFNGSTTPHVMRDDRTGIGCVSKFSLGMTIDIDKYFPILTGKKMYPHLYESEFKWFI